MTVWMCRNVLGCLVVLAGVLSGGAEPSRRDQPNIIFLLTDDQRDNSFGIMGHEFVKTPNVDKLIRSGVRFSNAYIAEPTCAPSRVAFFTGMHERVNGVGFTSSYRLNDEQWEQTYPALLKRSGYYTGFIGKFGVEYYTFRGQADKRFDFWRGHDGWANFFPKANDTNCKIYHDSGEEIITPVMGESITRFLDQAPADAPFCLSVSFSVPHGSQMMSMHDWEARACENPKLKGHPVYGYLYRDQGIGIPAETATDPYRFIPKAIMDQDQGRKGKIYPYDYTVEACREHHIRYYQQITGLDLVIGDMVETLKAKGLDQNTVIIFSSDHGLLMGEYGMGGKALLYDLTAKFPCFVYDPRLPEELRGRDVKELVSSLDITSSILEYAGVGQPAEMQGSSLVPLMKGENVEWRKHLFLENLYTGRDTPFSEGIRKGKWKYIRMYDGVEGYTETDLNFAEKKPDFEQLFDLQLDPSEMNNLIEKYEGSPVLTELREMCGQSSDELNDCRARFRDRHGVTQR
ncbi:sulfatase-like hydrolase/transferase [Pontiella sulfatireligans]|uniref:Arylsulfatase n=1 Tax=Pontiella sulfatireligans TaxID=2750658 RepID=A0A6C2UEP1_9BACT|nr:sulfatase-like hydrolase/transferase [Pontiella sulfatireligans]SPS74208.1 sulfatase S1_25 [Kiritimatiellales bacterium]VGO18625.1 Arylsulfatase [Pontiella sulfatireligans]